MAMPEGSSAVWPGSRVRSWSRQARRSRPAEPGVAYSGSGQSSPRRGSRMRTFRRFIGSVFPLDHGFNDDSNQLARQGLLGHGSKAPAPAGAEHFQRIVLGLESQSDADPVGRDQVKLLCLELAHGGIFQVTGFGGEADHDARPRRAAGDFGNDVWIGYQLKLHVIR